MIGAENRMTCSFSRCPKILAVTVIVVALFIDLLDESGMLA